MEDKRGVGLGGVEGCSPPQRLELSTTGSDCLPESLPREATKSVISMTTIKKGKEKITPFTTVSNGIK